MGYGMEGWGSWRWQHFSLLRNIKTALGLTQPHIQWAPGGIFPRVKWSGRDAEYSPPYSAEAKNSGVTPPLPHMSSWHGA
jgi:hypothetical protein